MRLDLAAVKPAVGLTAEDMPEWWPEDKPPQKLKEGFIYKDRDGRWRFADGRLASRPVRRRAGVR